MYPSTPPQPPRSRRRLVAGLASTALAAGLLATTGTPARALPINPPEPPDTIRTTTTTVPVPNTPPTARFTWSRAKRVGGANLNGTLDELAAYIRSPFQVNLDACTSKPGSAPIASYRWNVNGAIFNGCRVTWSTTVESTVPVSVTVTDTAGRSSTSSQQVMVRDHFVMVLGDSIAAGEGNPSVPAEWYGPVKTKDAVWPNTECHRTPNAGSQKAMNNYEQAHPKESVTFVNLGCSGAKILHVLQARLGGEAYEGAEPDGTPQEPQLDQVEGLTARSGRRPEMVYLSAGANDFGFADIAMGCLRISDAMPFPLCAQLDPMVAAGDKLLVGAPKAAVDSPEGWTGSRYAALGRAFTAAGIGNDRVAISHYPDPTRKDDGTFCNAILDDTPLSLAGHRIHAVDVAWAGNPTSGPVAVLNRDVTAAAGRNGWKLVPGILTDFSTHGYCATNGWIVTYSFASHNQGNATGSLHPNAAGTNNYARRIIEGAVATGLLPA